MRSIEEVMLDAKNRGAMSFHRMIDEETAQAMVARAVAQERERIRKIIEEVRRPYSMNVDYYDAKALREVLKALG